MNFINTFIYSKQLGIRIARHVIFWTADITNYLLVVSLYRSVDTQEVYHLLFKMPLIMLVTYFILYYLIPQASKQPNKAFLFLWALIIMAYLGIGVRYYNFYIINPIINPGQLVKFNIWDFRRVLSDILQSMVVVSMATAIKLIKSKTELQERNNQLIEEKKMAELNFLKLQMHPHFLFNTLNTLYSDAIMGSGRAEQIVLHLSNLLRFILEECSKPLVSIDKEIKVIDDYIALEMLRHGGRLRIDLKRTIKDDTKLISPLLLLPFVENSCKHTLSSKAGAIVITATIVSDDAFIRLFIENELNESGTVNGISHGMGISNIKKQLKLLYGSNFTLDVKKGNGKYAVNLAVPLTDGPPIEDQKTVGESRELNYQASR